jgi:mRNA interferase HigB
VPEAPQEVAKNQLDPKSGSHYTVNMRIIARKTIKDFWEGHSDAEQPLQAWYADVKRSRWRSPADIRSLYRSVSLIANNRVVFNIKGNAYRVVVAIQYQFGIVYIHFVGTHEEYDRNDAATI